MCGIVGIYHKNKDVGGEIYDGLIQVQHRGQDAAGICTWDKEKMSLYKKPFGGVTEVFKTNGSLKMGGKNWRWACSLSNRGERQRAEAQPFYSANPVNFLLHTTER
ncbi:MAG: hypothetical protein Ct9H300mP18_02710 [Candidatus Neomarinimicrobiota bacterium]|nr:MAG: hypothetical protein Ct9H300mP18_02710 [Candidatus Neomarinimicrobiota bacterium]